MISQASLNKAYSYMLTPASSTSSAQASKASDSASSSSTQSSASPISTPGEPVTISSEGRAAFEKSQSAWAAIANNPDPNISVQQYAIPDWLAATMEDVDSLPGHPNYNAGAISNTNKLSSAEPSIRNEYSSLISAHYKDVLQKNGINTTEDHYNALINDKSTSDKIHQEFKDSISSDKRLSEIIQQLGIQIS